MAPGIRSMPVIRDHLEWWICIVFEGFKSHVNVNKALQKFVANNIRSVQEEADTSYMSQLYDRAQALVDKHAPRQLLEMAKT